MNKVIRKLKSNKKAMTAVIIVSFVIVLSVIVLLLIPNHLSIAKFKYHFGIENHFDKYTNFNDYKNLSHYTGRVIDGKKTGQAYIVCHGDEAQKAFDHCVSDSGNYEIKKVALAKSIGSFGVPVTDFYVFMFVFKNSSDAEEFYDHYSGYVMYGPIEHEEGKNFSYTVCYRKSDGCYLENDTVLILQGYGGRLFFDRMCKHWGIKSPYDPSLDKRAGSK